VQLSRFIPHFSGTTVPFGFAQGKPFGFHRRWRGRLLRVNQAGFVFSISSGISIITLYTNDTITEQKENISVI
jgi:hypothetical protein